MASPVAKVVDASLRVKVIVDVPPIAKDVGEAVILTVGATVSTGNDNDVAVFANAPTVDVHTPAAIEITPFATLDAVGVNTAV